MVALKEEMGIIRAGSASQLLQKILPGRRAKRSAVQGGNQVMFFTENGCHFSSLSHLGTACEQKAVNRGSNDQDWNDK